VSYIEDVVQRVTMNERRIDDLIRPETVPDMISCFMALPMLRGFWPMAPIDSGGDCYDQSGHGHVLSYNGNPTYNYTTNLVPYIDLDGTGDYLTRTDEADLDITGTETYVDSAVRGLTWGLWCYPEETGTAEYIFSKFGAVGNYSYLLWIRTTDDFRANISDDGTNMDIATSAVVSMDAWYFVVGRFDPSNFVELYVNGTWYQGATARASVFNSNADLVIGAGSGGVSPFNGLATLAFLCAADLSDAIIDNLFQQTRGLFGV